MKATILTKPTQPMITTGISTAITKYRIMTVRLISHPMNFWLTTFMSGLRRRRRQLGQQRPGFHREFSVREPSQVRLVRRARLLGIAKRLVALRSPKRGFLRHRPGREQQPCEHRQRRLVILLPQRQHPHAKSGFGGRIAPALSPYRVIERHRFLHVAFGLEYFAEAEFCLEVLR